MISSLIFLTIFITFSVILYFLLKKTSLFPKTNVEKIKDIMKNENTESIKESESESESESKKETNREPNFYSNYLGYFNNIHIIDNIFNFIDSKRKDFEKTMIDLFANIYLYFESSIFVILSPISKIYLSSKTPV
jgi:hypothetical protein